MKYPIVILAILFLFSCASPQRHFKKGNYEKAYKGALKELEKQQDSRKNKSLLNKALKELVFENQKNGRLLLRSDHIEDWESAYRKNIDLLTLYEEGRRYVLNKWANRMDSLELFNDKLEQDIAINYWQMGLDNMENFQESFNKLEAQDAHHYFLKADEYKYEDERIDSLLEVSYELGLIHILFETDVWDMSYNWLIDNKFRNIIHESHGFLMVHYENNLSYADCRIDINFNSIERKDRDYSSTEDFTKEILDGYDTVVDSTGQSQSIPRYITITGSVNIIETQRTYSWRVRSNVRTLTPFCQMRNERFEVNRSISIEKYILSGDKRAIPDRYKRRNEEFSRQQEDDLIENLIEDIYHEIVRYYL